MKPIKIYADGGCRGNGTANSVGGWGVVLLHGEKEKRLFGGLRGVTNNVMELTAVIKGLSALNIPLINTKGFQVKVYMDSQYVIHGITKWVAGWERNGWKTQNAGEVANKELWQTLRSLTKKIENLEFVKVRGHSGDYYNEIADQLANEAMNRLVSETDKIEEGVTYEYKT